MSLFGVACCVPLVVWCVFARCVCCLLCCVCYLLSVVCCFFVVVCCCCLFIVVCCCLWCVDWRMVFLFVAVRRVLCVACCLMLLVDG